MSPAPRGIQAVVLAGGAGERFWPASRVARPKPLLRVAAGESLLRATVGRARRVADESGVWMICGHEHARAMRTEAGLPASRVIVEPERRNTAMAVAVAAQRIAQTDPDAVMAILPADHRIPEGRAFAAALRRAARAASAEGVLVTLGVRPTRAETGYGYVRLGASVGSSHAGLHRVARFVEKPSKTRARRYVEDGRYLWNAGIFVWTARAILEEIEQHAPEVHRALAPVRGPKGRPPRGVAAFRAALGRAYRRAPSLPIDVAVLERSRRVWCLPVSFRWSDVGTWESLAETLGVDPNVTRIIDGEAVLCDSGGNLVWAQDRPIALLGVTGLAVIDAGDALLVARLDRSGDVREIVRKLRRRGRDDLV
jgi:mannose-1-phosphate guanylyltransferase/mannose-6-phosphate isomerase